MKEIKVLNKAEQVSHLQNSGTNNVIIILSLVVVIVLIAVFVLKTDKKK